MTTIPPALASYAQNREDLYLWGMLAHRTPGYYVDIGCNHEAEGSVTRMFYEQGWSGVNVDANVRFAEEYVVRTRDVFIHAGVGAEAGTMEFREYLDDHGRSTFDHRLKAEYEDTDRRYVDAIVPIRTLDDILTEVGAEQIDFLKIDVEGMEPEVLRGLNLNLWRPAVVVVEGGPVPECAAVLHEHYVPALFDGLNTYFLDAAASDLSLYTYVERVLMRGYSTSSERALREEVESLRYQVKELLVQRGKVSTFAAPPVLGVRGCAAQLRQAVLRRMRR